jgi:hypothetical protein
MMIQSQKPIVCAVLLAVMFVLGMSGVSWSAEYWLRAETLTKTMPDNAVVTMWGFAQCTDGAFTACAAATVPGPALNVPPADSTLTIHLRNNLTGPYVEPISIVIPGQTIIPTPVRNPNGRMRSFTVETPADNSTTVDYTWTNLRPGTYLYQSGTHPAVQVQMGLYGSLVKDAAAGQAYGPSTSYAAQAVLLFSEIDPALHAAVALASYGTPSYPSTLNYEPKYFLINGEPYSAATSTPVPAGNVGASTLLRFLNAGLEHRVPTILGIFLSLVAEDGNPYPSRKENYSFMLAPGKTIDAVVMPAAFGAYALFDRRLGLTNGAAGSGGMLTTIAVAPAVQGIGIFRAGAWYLDMNGNGTWDAGIDAAYSFGIAGDRPVTGDWSGSGTARIGVMRGNQWHLDMNGNGAWDDGIDQSYVFGIAGDIPVAGDWTGSQSSKIGVFRSGAWLLDTNGNGVWDEGTDVVYSFGIAGDKPVCGDWTGNGTSKIGVMRGNTWYLDLNGNGTWDDGIDGVYSFGIPSDVPVVGDWNGTGTAKIGVVRGSTWLLDINGNGTWDQGTDGIIPEFGIPGDIPVAGRW